VSRRLIIEVALLVGLLVAAALWSYGRMVNQHEAAIAANADLAACRNMAKQFKSLGRRTTPTEDLQHLEAETTSRIEQAAKDAGIGGGLELINPESTRRLADSAYKTKPTRVILKDVTLGQLVAFLHPLIADPGGLNATFIRLTAPRPDDTTDTWSAQVILTYLLYDPPTQPRP
jgi:type II secretory pathway pseudopilin PulG